MGVYEDLGLLTPEAAKLRDRFRFPGMRIMQFGFGSSYHLPHSFPRRSVAYTGTHDNDTVRGWWDHANARERAYAGSYLACGEHDVHWAMIRACCNSVANMAVFPLQDVLGLGSEARMNTPGVGKGNWRWRATAEQVSGGRLAFLAVLTETYERAN